MSPLRRAAVLAALLALPLGASACTLDPDGPEPSATPSAPSTSTTPAPTPVSETTTPSPDPTGSDDPVVDAEPFPADTSDDLGEGTGLEVGTLVDLRVGAHDGFTRVVLELDGPDVPAWQVGYVDAAIGDPSGVSVEVGGAAVLQVLLNPVAYPEDGTTPYAGPTTVSALGALAVDEAVLSSIFEGELQAFVGVTGHQRPFRVYGMTDPARVVIEVQDPLG